MLLEENVSNIVAKVKKYRWWGILVEKVICVAPGHNKFRISVFLDVVHLRFLFKGLMAN